MFVQFSVLHCSKTLKWKMQSHGLIKEADNFNKATGEAVKYQRQQYKKNR